MASIQQQLQQQLEKINKKLQEDSKMEYTLEELFPNEFISKHSKFSSISELFISGGFKVKTNEDLNNIDDVKLNDYIKSNTTFNSWHDMMQTAGKIKSYERLKSKGYNFK